MSPEFAKLISSIVQVEGGYVNDPTDRGGATKYGITERVARANGYRGDMRVLPLTTAVDIYYRQYVVAPGFDRVGEVDMGLAAELIDAYVNMGKGNRETKDGPEYWLQRCLNAFNRNGKDYPDIAVDGDIGNGTINALKAFKAKRGNVDVLTQACNCMQGARYMRIVEANATQEKFAWGWFVNRVVAHHKVSNVLRAFDAPTETPEAEVTPERQDIKLFSYWGHFVLEMLKTKLGEKSTVMGILLLLFSILQNPQVFDGAGNVINTIRSGHNITAIAAAVASLLLVVLKENANRSVKDKVEAKLGLKG